MSIPLTLVDLGTLQRSECTCARCVSACRRRVGWGTPAEMRRIIDAGHGKQLMLDWWAVSGGKDISMLSVAAVGYEGRPGPDWPSGHCCTFLRDDRCTIHAIKPVECWGTMACGSAEDYKGVHETIAATWNTDEGRTLVAEWCAEHGVENNSPDGIDVLCGFLDSFRMLGVLLGMCVALGGCNTLGGAVSGFARDLEGAGRIVEDVRMSGD